MVSIELTDELASRLRAAQNGAPDAGQTVTELVREVVALLPPETVDPRTLPPGRDLDRLVCAAMGRHEMPLSVFKPHCKGLDGTWYTGCNEWSTDPDSVGLMLDWLHERSWNYMLDNSDDYELQLRRRGLPTWQTVVGETPQHALAIACAVVGESNG